MKEYTLSTTLAQPYEKADAAVRDALALR